MDQIATGDSSSPKNWVDLLIYMVQIPPFPPCIGQYPEEVERWTCVKITVKTLYLQIPFRNPTGFYVQNVYACFCSYTVAQLETASHQPTVTGERVHFFFSTKA